MQEDEEEETEGQYNFLCHKDLQMRESELRDYAARLRPDEECERVTLDIMECGESLVIEML